MSNKPYQVVPSFCSTYLVANQLMTGSWGVILFNIIETDGTEPAIYDPTTGQFSAPTSGWYDMDVQLQSATALTGVRIVRNGDTNFPPMSEVPATANVSLKLRIQLGLGETLRVEAIGAVNVLALSGTSPNARVSNVIFTLIKRFEDTRNF
jgi:hypothetical protein